MCPTKPCGAANGAGTGNGLRGLRERVAAWQRTRFADLVIADLSTIWAYAAVFQQNAGRVRVGDPASFTVDAWPGERFDGALPHSAAKDMQVLTS